MRQNKWLVLIGVEFYMDGNARLSHFSSLEGPIHDLESVREFFADKVGIDNDHILILKSTNPERASVDTDVNSIPKNEPMERDRSEWPTYENILKVLDKVTTSAERGDLVYVYYSGHGGRATTTFPQKKGVRGVDETLVPLDVNCGGRYVRDFEIAALIHKMIQQKGLHVTLIFDSCHSGGATKDQKPNGMVARGSSNLNVQILPTDTSDLSEEDLIAACQAGAMDPSTSETSFWL
ncbi:hypothetical protein H9Q74_008130 [Fusarium xylarioides]|nr:hypothetical protein H9Q74_008130 [Fusarium xylarioides]